MLAAGACSRSAWCSQPELFTERVGWDVVSVPTCPVFGGAPAFGGKRCPAAAPAACEAAQSQSTAALSEAAAAGRCSTRKPWCKENSCRFFPCRIFCWYKSCAPLRLMEITRKVYLWPLRMWRSAGSEAAWPRCCAVPAGQLGAGWPSWCSYGWALAPVRSPLMVSTMPDCALPGAASPLPTALADFGSSRAGR